MSNSKCNSFGVAPFACYKTCWITLIVVRKSTRQRKKDNNTGRVSSERFTRDYITCFICYTKILLKIVKKKKKENISSVKKNQRRYSVPHIRARSISSGVPIQDLSYQNLPESKSTCQFLRTQMLLRFWTLHLSKALSYGGQKYSTRSRANQKLKNTIWRWQSSIANHLTNE